MKQSNRQGQKMQLGLHQMPRLTSHLLTLNRISLMTELRTRAEQNPILEVNDAEVPKPVVDATPTLTEHLTNQLEKMPLANQLRSDALNCIGHLSDRGYLPIVDELKKATSLPLKRTKDALNTIRTLHPIGVGAHDLAGSLSLQIDELPKSSTTTLAKTILTEHFDALSRGRHDLLPKRGLDEALKVISSLQPSFANSYSSAADYLSPDLQIFNDHGVWRVQHFEHPFIARLREGYLYSQQGRKGASWRKLVNEAKTVVNALEFRGATLLRVAQALADRQSSFFDSGASLLKAVTLKDLAKDTGLSISTVSATIRNKSIALLGSVITLKYLLQRQTAGDNLSAVGLQQAIKKMVVSESPSKPFTDDLIMQKLLTNNFGKVSRRTVAKHRTRAGILPSQLRRIR